MEEVQNESSFQEVAPPVTETKETGSVNPQVVEKEAGEDTNWIKKLRKDRDEAIRRSKAQEDELRLKNQMIEQFMSRAPVQAPAQPEEDILGDLEQQEYVAGPKVVKGFKRLEEKFERKVQEIEKKYAAQSKASEFNELRKIYPDFEQVVNNETLSLLEEKNPRLARSILNNPDPIDKAVQSYEYIKAHGLFESSPKIPTEVEKRLDQNKKSASAPIHSEARPIVQAFKTLEAERNALHAEMMKYSAMGGGAY